MEYDHADNSNFVLKRKFNFLFGLNPEGKSCFVRSQNRRKILFLFGLKTEGLFYLVSKQQENPVFFSRLKLILAFESFSTK